MLVLHAVAVVLTMLTTIVCLLRKHLTGSACSYWSDPVVLEKMSKVMGDVFQKEDEPGEGVADEEVEGAEGDDEPITLHSCARDGAHSQPFFISGRINLVHFTSTPPNIMVVSLLS